MLWESGVREGELPHSRSWERGARCGRNGRAGTEVSAAGGAEGARQQLRAAQDSAARGHRAELSSPCGYGGARGTAVDEARAYSHGSGPAEVADRGEGLRWGRRTAGAAARGDPRYGAVLGRCWERCSLWEARVGPVLRRTAPRRREPPRIEAERPRKCNRGKALWPDHRCVPL